MNYTNRIVGIWNKLVSLPNIHRNTLNQSYPLLLNQTIILQFQRNFLNFTPSPKVEKNKPKGQEDRKPRNNEITSKYINLIDKEGKPAGLKPLWKVLKELDKDKDVLIQLDKSTENAYCRIYSIKELYEKEKQLSQNKKGVKMALKELKIGTNISEHDLFTKLKNASKMIYKGHPVQVQVSPQNKNKKFRKENEPVINQLLQKIQTELSEVAVISKPSSIVEGIGYITFKPNDKTKKLQTTSKDLKEE